MFGFKKKTHRDRAAALCVEHCRKEAGLLRDRILAALAPYHDGDPEKLTIAHIASFTMVRFAGGKFQSHDRNLLDAHCYAIALAAGLGSREAIDPPDQSRVMQWQINKLIVEEDVGLENVGRAPNPFPRPGMHVSYAPGTFVHGIPSLQQRLTNRYLDLDSAPERLTMLLLSLRALQPVTGVHIAIYDSMDLGNGMIGRNKVGYAIPTPDQIDEWEDNLEIADADAALSTLPAELSTKLISAIEMIDPFWPKFSRMYRLTW